MNLEASTTFVTLADRDTPPMRLDDSLDDRKAEPRSVLVRRITVLEHRLAIRPRNTGPVVRDEESRNRPRLIGDRADTNRDWWVVVFAGVPKEVLEDVSKAVIVRLQLHAVWNIHFEVDIVATNRRSAVFDDPQKRDGFGLIDAFARS